MIDNVSIKDSKRGKIIIIENLYFGTLLAKLIFYENPTFFKDATLVKIKPLIFYKCIIIFENYFETSFKKMEFNPDFLMVGGHQD